MKRALVKVSQVPKLGWEFFVVLFLAFLITLLVLPQTSLAWWNDVYYGNPGASSASNVTNTFIRVIDGMQSYFKYNVWFRKKVEEKNE